MWNAFFPALDAFLDKRHEGIKAFSFTIEKRANVTMFPELPASNRDGGMVVCSHSSASFFTFRTDRNAQVIHDARRTYAGRKVYPTCAVVKPAGRAVSQT